MPPVCRVFLECSFQEGFLKRMAQRTYSSKAATIFPMHGETCVKIVTTM